MINLSDVAKSYRQGGDDYQVLHDINVTISAGEFVAIMGPSGSGKSTLINIIGFLDQHFDGSYVFDDVTVSKLNRKQHAKLRNQSVGFIFQNFKLITNQSVGENVGLPLLYAGMKRRDIFARVNDVLAQVGLPNSYHKLPKNLSGGQQQRVAIARSIVTRPNFLVADEPTGALDSATSAEIMALFKALNQDGTTVIMVTHDEEVALQTNRLIRILDGRIKSDEEVSHANT
ncbi:MULTISPECIES: ABC transporter ATP-binding protein [Leuconostoc]|jgi:putative ABC transport system ATP-binding protein|uniref:Peptide ABC transporter ATP-binding protein n=1 Tax=Leuconostoc citreum TaxID=33964 RepID=A0A5A5U1E3_LEUCI|nr:MULTISPECIES: ABC transporter ATP-binding protein [Leuconostoc]KAF0260580.1 ABC transporter ATP-binding protein [Leuconostoc citreum]MBA5937744.1 ABC transporter ATP-binding protein [Leuconostoc citreum]MBE4726122.1 ABC transporter ATP-binding protein [Leuconostoc citreum]MBU7451187.1 ABC transporter ATP-binding protein [Leuconostoc citreum]MCP1275850.1 ABC transporter ATP-binding protein [Leuconostoc citreum]